MAANKEHNIACSGDGHDDCDGPALYVRHTQFAGSHPFCMFHAMAERGFLDNDSYTFWEKLEKDDSCDTKDDL